MKKEGKIIYLDDYRQDKTEQAREKTNEKIIARTNFLRGKKPPEKTMTDPNQPPPAG